MTWSPTDSGCHDFNLMSVKLIMINNHLTSPPPHHLSETLICFCSIIYITCCVILSLFIFLFLPLRGNSLFLLRGNKSIKQPREAFSQFASTLKAGPKVAANPAHQTAASRHAEAHVWEAAASSSASPLPGELQINHSESSPTSQPPEALISRIWS